MSLRLADACIVDAFVMYIPMLHVALSFHVMLLRDMKCLGFFPHFLRLTRADKRKGGKLEGGGNLKKEKNTSQGLTLSTWVKFGDFTVIQNE